DASAEVARDIPDKGLDIAFDDEVQVEIGAAEEEVPDGAADKKERQIEVFRPESRCPQGICIRRGECGEEAIDEGGHQVRKPAEDDKCIKDYTFRVDTPKLDCI